MDVHDIPCISRRDDEQIQPARQADQFDLCFIAERENTSAEVVQIAAHFSIDDMMGETCLHRALAATEARLGGDDEADIDVQPPRRFLVEKVLERTAGATEQHGDFKRLRHSNIS